MNDNNTIQVPISIMMENLKNSTIKAINTSNLPLYIVEMILRDILAEVADGARKQIEIDRQNYEQAIKEEQENEASTDEE